MTSIIDTVQLWEDRITILKEDARLVIDEDNNSLELTLPYVLNDRNIGNVFKRTIIL